MMKQVGFFRERLCGSKHPDLQVREIGGTRWVGEPGAEAPFVVGLIQGPEGLCSLRQGQ